MWFPPHDAIPLICHVINSDEVTSQWVVGTGDTRGRDDFLSAASQGPKVSFNPQVCDLTFTSDTGAPVAPETWRWGDRRALEHLVLRRC